MDVFIGHTYEAAKFVHRISKDLRAAGFTVWTAEEDVKPGENWTRELSRIIQDAQNLVFILSRSGSVSFALTSEIALALAVSEGDKAKRIIPILVDSSAEMPFFLKRYQALDMSGESSYAIAFDRLVQTLKEPSIQKSRSVTSDDIDLTKIGEEALRIENEAWRLERTSRTLTLFQKVAGLLSAVTLAIVLAFALQGAGIFGGILANPLVMLVVGAVAGFFAPQATQKLTEVFTTIFTGSKEVKANR